jgi:hypothetical protein
VLSPGLKGPRLPALTSYIIFSKSQFIVVNGDYPNYSGLAVRIKYILTLVPSPLVSNLPLVRFFFKADRKRQSRTGGKRQEIELEREKLPDSIY